jgi:hypothetical protein
MKRRFETHLEKYFQSFKIGNLAIKKQKPTTPKWVGWLDDFHMLD